MSIRIWKEEVDHTFDPETDRVWILLSQEVFWRTKEKEVLPIDEMSARHVENTYKLLLRWESRLKDVESFRIDSMLLDPWVPDNIVNDIIRWSDEIHNCDIRNSPLMRKFLAKIQAKHLRQLDARTKAYKFAERYS